MVLYSRFPDQALDLFPACQTGLARLAIAWHFALVLLQHASQPEAQGQLQWTIFLF